ncbi:MAG: LysM peptidoglycan-binding domain-containing protein [Chloroflexota bacterium]|nr:MAG: LysM peptidoglycan-binding domain-containing protein [Chloroflexota bacterium]
MIYNCFMRPKTILPQIVIILLLSGFLRPLEKVQATPIQPAPPAQSGGVTAFDLIIAMNTLRMANGLPALIENPIVNAVAQSTAEIMAANQMSWHIGDVRGRIAAAGYGGGGQVWATENFAVGNMTIDEIMSVWADPDHMRPAMNPAYCNVGAGVARSSNGMTYYILQAAYISGRSCGDNNSPGGQTPQPGGTSNPNNSPVSQLIVPVKLATPDADGKIFHVVQAGQSFWAIAVAYRITIHDLEVWNNLSRDSGLRVGQRLFIPGSNTEGYATPTPVGMIVPSTPAADGKIVHTVQAYQALITIAEAYDVTVDTILALNGIQEDWPLQIGQKLLISAGWITPSPTPRPLTPVETLTPASDGRYYHVVQSGESLSWIAGLYNIALTDLMAWNGLNSASIIRPEQKLLLQVTPPATVTATPAPPTATATVTPTPPAPTATRTATRSAPSPTSTSASVSQRVWISSGWPIFAILAAAAGLILLGIISRKKP